MITSEDDVTSPPMKGVQFVTDTSGHKVAVILDLHEWGELWEDIYDAILAHQRADEPAATLAH